MNEYEKEMMDLYKKSLGEKQDFHGIVCPGSHKKPCRLCELCKEVLFNRAIPKEAPLRKRASSLNAKQHYFSNIVFLADPSAIVVFEYGDKVFKQLLAMQMNADQGFKDFWHPIAGRWLIIERIQGATKEQVDYYVKPKDPSKIPDMSVLSRMVNLSQISDLIKDGKAKSIYQSKLEKTSIIRILPSWLGPDFGLKFFEKIDYHYNISEEDFRACLAGEVNPVRITGSDSPPETPKAEWKPIGTEPKWEVPAKQQEAQQKIPDKEENEWEKMYNISIKTVPIPSTNKVVETPMPLEEEDDLPACYGEFDATDPDCASPQCPEWAEGCHRYKDEKLAKRRAAKRISR
jgi:hypothetical protein